MPDAGLDTAPRTAPGIPRGGIGWWSAGVAIAAGIVALPVLTVFWLALFPSENIWPHLIETVLPHYVSMTLGLMAGVLIGTALIGVATAWLVSMCRFPGQRVFGWALLLPMAVPAYVVAYVYTDILEYAGPVQIALRQVFGWRNARDYWFPEIRSLGGAICVMSLALYPYVYLLARSAFLEQTNGVAEAARSLGAGAWSTFFKIALPMARPSIVVGLALVLMETLNDFGTVDFFAVQTLTAGLFNVWFQMNNSGGGAQIALVMLAFVVALLAAEQFARRRRRYYATTSRHRPPPAISLSGVFAAIAFSVCALPLFLGFVVPGGLLLFYAIDFFGDAWSSRYPEAAFNTVFLAGSASIAAVAIGLLMAYAVRLNPSAPMKFLTRFASVGYAIPGAVIAIGVLIPFGLFDNSLDAVMRRAFGVSTGLLLSGTIFAVMFAYIVRFLALSYGTLEAGMSRITPNMEMAARTLGLGPGRTLWRVNLPIMRSSLITAAILIFVDCMKELPATLILRPFNFDTLATYVYQFASDERLENCAVGALSIVVAGILPVIFLSRTMAAPRPGQSPDR